MPYELTETLYEPEAKDGTVVKEGDPRARFLVGVAGQTLSDAEAARLGLSQEPPAGKSQAEAPERKAVQPEDAANKSLQMGGDAKAKGR